MKKTLISLSPKGVCHEVDSRSAQESPSRLRLCSRGHFQAATGRAVNSRRNRIGPLRADRRIGTVAVACRAESRQPTRTIRGCRSSLSQWYRLPRVCRGRPGRSVDRDRYAAGGTIGAETVSKLQACVLISGVVAQRKERRRKPNMLVQIQLTPLGSLAQSAERDALNVGDQGSTPWGTFQDQRKLALTTGVCDGIIAASEPLNYHTRLTNQNLRFRWAVISPWPESQIFLRPQHGARTVLGCKRRADELTDRISDQLAHRASRSEIVQCAARRFYSIYGCGRLDSDSSYRRAYSTTQDGSDIVVRASQENRHAPRCSARSVLWWGLETRWERQQSGTESNRSQGNARIPTAGAIPARNHFKTLRRAHQPASEGMTGSDRRTPAAGVAGAPDRRCSLRDGHCATVRQVSRKTNTGSARHAFDSRRVNPSSAVTVTRITATTKPNLGGAYSPNDGRKPISCEAIFARNRYAQQPSTNANR